ncbi:hypothetical protein WJX81_006380 [Elliptochloris bilobata]|uniref:EamA domain-containing protein n=1 Tax=Elliptochloris bilobata TaxID=381761 RepID=A0AAW1S7P5_9CHLO
MPEPPATSAASASPGKEDARKEKLRKAGQEYFEKVLAQANQGKQSHIEPPRARRRAPVDVEDPDLKTVGLVLEGTRLYFFGGVLLAASAASPVLIKASLQGLQTPAILVFLHLVPTISALWLLFSVKPLQLRALQGCSIQAALAGVQVLALFGALLHGSLYLVLGATTLLPQVLRAAARAASGQRASLPQLAAVAAGVVGAGAAVVAGARPNGMAALCLGAWGAAEAVAVLWEYVRREAAPGAALWGSALAARLAGVAAEEARLDVATAEFLRAALPAAPALLVGFLCGEGALLVSHELSVPAVTAMLLSALAFATAAWSGLALADALSPRARAGLQALAALAALAVTVALHGVPLAPVVLLASTLAVIGGAGARLAAIAEEIQ